MKRPDLTCPSSADAILGGFTLTLLLAIVACYVRHSSTELIRFLTDAFTGFNGALLLSLKITHDPPAPPKV